MSGGEIVLLIMHHNEPQSKTKSQTYGEITEEIYYQKICLPMLWCVCEKKLYSTKSAWQTDRQRDGRTDRQTDRQMDGRTGKLCGSSQQVEVRINCLYKQTHLPWPVANPDHHDTDGVFWRFYNGPDRLFFIRNLSVSDNQQLYVSWEECPAKSVVISKSKLLW